MSTCNHCGKPVGPKFHVRSQGYCHDCELLTVPEAIAALRTSRATYYRLVRAGRLSPRHISPGRVLVPRRDIDNIRAGEVPKSNHYL